MIGGDRISIRALELETRVGWGEAERQTPQRIAIDIDAGCDLRQAGKSGELSDTTNYEQIKDELITLIQSRPWKLIEEIAECSAALVLENFPAITSVGIKCRKFIFPETQWVGVEIYRERDR